MRPTERALYRVTPRDGETATGALPDEASREANPNDIGGDAWSALLKHAQSCDAYAYEDLYLRLKRFRQCFTPHVFPDPEGAYRQFVNELVDRIRYGFLPDPHALLAQARKSAVRRASNRIRSLTMAARVLSSLPKRHREVLIRAQLALCASARLGQDVRGIPVRRADATGEPAPRKPIMGGNTAANYKSPAAVA